MTALEDKEKAAPRSRWVRFQLPRCPFCGSTKLRTEHSERRKNGERVRHARCGKCKERVYLIPK